MASHLSGREPIARLAVTDGAAGAVWAPRGHPVGVIDFAIAGGKIVAIDVLANPDRLRRLDLTILTS